MTIEHFLEKAVSSWMNQQGPQSDIVMSSRVRLARNLNNFIFPVFSNENNANKVMETVRQAFHDETEVSSQLSFFEMQELQKLQKRVLVEKHLISPYLAEAMNDSGVFISEGEDVSIMVNEEDHIRIQCLLPGLQLQEALDKANQIDDILESKLDYAFDENFGYLTTCPTNVGTGLRASVMVHLPALVLTQQMNKIIQAVNNLGLVVRGIFGEGSEALGNIFQISNQVTLGEAEEDIVSDLISVVNQIIMQERSAREALIKSSNIQLEDKVFRSLGVLENSRLIGTKEASKCLSDVRLGIDIGYIEGIDSNILNELIILIQPGFLQLYAGGELGSVERDIRRSTLIRERIKLQDSTNS